MLCVVLCDVYGTVCRCGVVLSVLSMGDFDAHFRYHARVLMHPKQPLSLLPLLPLLPPPVFGAGGEC